MNEEEENDSILEEDKNSREAGKVLSANVEAAEKMLADVRSALELLMLSSD